MTNFNTGIEPKGDFIVVRLLAAPNRTAAGIHIPDGARNETIGRGLVMSVGPEVKRCAAGDVVVIGEARAYTIMGQGPEGKPKQYVLLREEGVIALDQLFVEQQREANAEDTSAHGMDTEAPADALPEKKLVVLQ